MTALGNTEITKAYLGNTEISKMYLGEELVFVSDTPAWEIPYITDGLIFMVDGIEKGKNSGTWTDLVGGIRFTNNNVTSTEYGWHFDGSTSSFYSSTVLTGSENNTVEVCFKPETTSAYCLFACNNQTTNNMLFYRNGNNIVFLQRKNYYTLSIPSNTPYSISLNLNNGLFNGNSVSKASSTDYWNNSNFWIGRRAGGTYFKGEIYSIRLYNRKLSQEEQLFNFNIDNERFNLTL